MDQMGSSVGGAVFIDFNDPANPIVERVDYDFSQSGFALCIVDTASSHGDLTDDYADITREMGAVAAHFGKAVLRDVPPADFQAALPALRTECGDRAVLRAMHFYDDDRLALAEAKRLLDGGAVRVHGGGFAGTIQAWVSEEYLTVFKNGMEELFGPGKCHILYIRPQGGCVVAE